LGDRHRATIVGGHVPVGDDELPDDVQGRKIDAHYAPRPAVVASKVHWQLERAAGTRPAQLDIGQALRLVGIGHIPERHRFGCLATVLIHPLLNPHFGKVGLGPGLRGIDERAGDDVDRRVVVDLGGARDRADDHVLGDLEVIRPVVGTGLHHPLAADADQLACAGFLQLLDNLGALLVGADNTTGTVANARRAVGVGHGLVAHVRSAGKGLENNLVIRHFAPGAQEPEHVQRRVVAVAGHTGARVVDIVSTAHYEAHVRDARREFLGIVLEREPNERQTPTDLSVAPVAAVRPQEGIDLGWIYQQLVGGIFTVGGDLLLAQIDAIQSSDCALAEYVHQVHPLAIGLIASLLLGPDQNATGVCSPEDEPSRGFRRAHSLCRRLAADTATL